MSSAKLRYWPFAWMAAAGLLAGGVLGAQSAPDSENCHDSPLIARMPGSRINGCDHKEFEQVKMRTDTNKEGEAIEKTLEGEYWYWEYSNREGVSAIQVFRNIETALRRAGWTSIGPHLRTGSRRIRAARDSYSKRTGLGLTSRPSSR